MDFVLTIPKGKNILEFLQELDGNQSHAENAWHFMHRDVVVELMNQALPTGLSPTITFIDGSCSFSLHYGSLQQRIGVIVLNPLPCQSGNIHHPLWFIVSELYLVKDSPIQIAFRQLSPIPSKAIFLALEE